MHYSEFSVSSLLFSFFPHFFSFILCFGFYIAARYCKSGESMYLCINLDVQGERDVTKMYLIGYVV